jgi:hypothetical protein
MSYQVSDVKPFNASMVVNYKTKEVVFGYPNPHNSFWDKFIIIFQIILLYYLVSFVILAAIATFLVAVITSPSETLSYNAIISQIIGVLAFLLGALIFFSPPIIISFIMAKDYSKFSKIFPKIGYFIINLLHGSSTTWIIDSSKMTEPKIEIPYFNNFFLGFEARRDFADYLDKVEILPIPSYEINKRGKMEPNEHDWKAVFTFSKMPLEGEILIDYI